MSPESDNNASKDKDPNALSGTYSPALDTVIDTLNNDEFPCMDCCDDGRHRNRPSGQTSAMAEPASFCGNPIQVGAVAGADLRVSQVWFERTCASSAG
ncbi:hypothetical protein Rhe02_65420 [Rhizocola hellebori]|uniref:Uncharacterized protein n=1 Tax=Rhizocola hellebori TaxID=1392758 RepID=A0A8J3QD43_9ACTN|nr:hypothetical protein Rhe02_65420 [Rhizocola hellebori]